MPPMVPRLAADGVLPKRPRAVAGAYMGGVGVQPLAQIRRADPLTLLVEQPEHEAVGGS